MSTIMQKYRQSSAILTVHTQDADIKPSHLGLLDVPEELIGRVCTYLGPCDVYSLCITNKRFPSQILHGPSMVRAPSMMNTFMKQSLHEGMSRALKSTKVPGLSMSSFKELVSKCSPGSVAVSGGTTVKAIFTKEWHSDVDIYCTLEESDKVRTWIIENWGQVMIKYSTANESSVRSSVRGHFWLLTLLLTLMRQFRNFFTFSYASPYAT